jgi:hypothetical protein
VTDDVLNWSDEDFHIIGDNYLKREKLNGWSLVSWLKLEIATTGLCWWKWIQTEMDKLDWHHDGGVDVNDFLSLITIGETKIYDL